jgi:hypothetical protein
MSTFSRSPSRVARQFVAVATRLMVAAILLQPAATVVRAVVPAESVEAQESQPAGESAESESSATPAPHTPRFVRRAAGQRFASPGIRAAKSAAVGRSPPVGRHTGHRLPNGLPAPLRC